MTKPSEPVTKPSGSVTRPSEPVTKPSEQNDDLVASGCVEHGWQKLGEADAYPVGAWLHDHGRSSRRWTRTGSAGRVEALRATLARGRRTY